jgi:hypothetical protein
MALMLLKLSGLHLTCLSCSSGFKASELVPEECRRERDTFGVGACTEWWGADTQTLTIHAAQHFKHSTVQYKRIDRADITTILSYSLDGRYVMCSTSLAMVDALNPPCCPSLACGPALLMRVPAQSE